MDNVVSRMSTSAAKSCATVFGAKGDNQQPTTGGKMNSKTFKQLVIWAVAALTAILSFLPTIGSAGASSQPSPTEATAIESAFNSGQVSYRIMWDYMTAYFNANMQFSAPIRPGTALSRAVCLFGAMNDLYRYDPNTWAASDLSPQWGQLAEDMAATNNIVDGIVGQVLSFIQRYVPNPSAVVPAWVVGQIENNLVSDLATSVGSALSAALERLSFNISMQSTLNTDLELVATGLYGPYPPGFHACW